MTIDVEPRVSRVSDFLSDRKVAVDKAPDYDLPPQFQIRPFAESILLTTNPPESIGIAIEFTDAPGGVRFEMRRQGTILQMEELSKTVDYDVHTPLAEMSHVAKVVFGDSSIVISGGGGKADPAEKEVKIDLTQGIIDQHQHKITPLLVA